MAFAISVFASDFSGSTAVAMAFAVSVFESDFDFGSEIS